jgi:tetratricopeptide (TPR) repeat protein
LEAALLLQPTPQQSVEILYDLAHLYYTYTVQYDKAESCLQKALLIASQSIQEDMISRIWDLQIQVYLATGKFHVAKQCIKTSLSHSHGEWTVRFLLRKLELHQSLDDWEGFFNCSKQLIQHLQSVSDFRTMVIAFDPVTCSIEADTIRISIGKDGPSGQIFAGVSEYCGFSIL